MVEVQVDRGAVLPVVRDLVDVEGAEPAMGEGVEQVLVELGLGRSRVAVAAQGDHQHPVVDRALVDGILVVEQRCGLEHGLLLHSRRALVHAVLISGWNAAGAPFIPQS